MRIGIDKDILLDLCASHSRLAQYRYNTGPYNNEHYSHKAEEAIIREIERYDLMNELFYRMELLEEKSP